MKACAARNRKRGENGVIVEFKQLNKRAEYYESLGASSTSIYS